MKLHLTKGLLVALLASVGQVMAAEYTLVDAGTITTGNFAPTTLANYDISKVSTTGSIYLGYQDWDESQIGDFGLYVNKGETAKVQAVLREHEASTVSKLGDGILEITGGFLDDSNCLSVNTIDIEEGTLKISSENHYFFSNETTTTVQAGATLDVAAAQTLGDGKEGNALASKILLKGGASLTGAGSVTFHDGLIKAEGKGNVISTTLKSNWDINIDVDSGGDLTITGAIQKSGSEKLKVTGGGSLILNSASVDNALDIYVDKSTLELKQASDRNYLLNGGTIVLHDVRTGADDGSSQKTITLQNGTVNTIKGGSRPGALFTDVTGTGDLILANGVNVYNDMSFKGNLTVKSGTYNFGYGATGGNAYGVSPNIANDGNITIEAGASVTLDARENHEAAKLANTGNITVNGKLTVNKGTIDNGGSISVQGTAAVGTEGDEGYVAAKIATLDVNSADAIGSPLSIGSYGVLDLSDVTTLNAESLSLAEGSRLKLSDGSLAYTGSLTIEDGAILDLSNWKAADGSDLTVYNFERDTAIFTGVTGINWGEDGDYVHVLIDFGDGNLWDNWLYKDGTTVYAIPEPTTATLSLLALAGLAARRRRK